MIQAKLFKFEEMHHDMNCILFEGIPDVYRDVYFSVTEVSDCLLGW